MMLLDVAPPSILEPHATVHNGAMTQTTPGTDGSPAALLRLSGVQVSYPRHGIAVDGVDLALQPGEIGVLLGASGSGKSSLLRALAGFEPLAAGQIELAGQVIARAGSGLPPEQRRLGMMFQDFAVFPHLNVRDNIGFGLRGLPRAQRDARVSQWVERVGLHSHAGRFPHELSGGQQQRVALARALAPEPALLLLDEPFSALDADTRERLIGELRSLFRQAGTTVLMVTHDQHEAFALGDRVGVMHRGRLLQWDAPEALYRAPATPEVAGFVGRGSVLPAAVLGLDGSGQVLLRPEHVQLHESGTLRASVLDVRFVGPGHVARLRLPGGEEFEADVDDPARWKPGQQVGLRLAPQVGGLRFA